MCRRKGGQVGLAVRQIISEDTRLWFDMGVEDKIGRSRGKMMGL